MDIVWEDKEANKFQCEEMIKEAADEHADIILFPEMYSYRPGKGTGICKI